MNYFGYSIVKYFLIFHYKFFDSRGLELFLNLHGVFLLIFMLINYYLIDLQSQNVVCKMLTSQKCIETSCMASHSIFINVPWVHKNYLSGMHTLLSTFTTGLFSCKTHIAQKSLYFLCNKGIQSSRNFKCEVMEHFLKHTNQGISK